MPASIRNGNKNVREGAEQKFNQPLLIGSAQEFTFRLMKPGANGAANLNPLVHADCVRNTR